MWVGGSSLNSDFFLQGWNFCVACVVFVVIHVSKKKKIRYGSGWVLSGQSEFFSDFRIFLT